MYVNISLVFVIIKMPVILCDFNFTDSTNKVKYVLENYKKVRCKRCLDLRANLGTLLDKTINLYERSGQFGNFLKTLNVNDCEKSASGIRKSYFKNSFLDELLVDSNVSEIHWNDYKTVFSKQYFTPHHEMSALAKWRHNLEKITQHNQEYLAGKHSYTLHLNVFGDFHVTDYFRKILKLIRTVPLFDPAEDFHRTTYKRSSKYKIPRRVDWRAKGYTPPLQEQWQCGACYAFAITHAVQAQVYMKHGDWRELSPQQIVDCSYRDGNMGCNGGSLRAALRYAARDGLIAEQRYPYTGQRGHCRYNPLLVTMRPRRWAALPQDESALETALAKIGPVPVGINAAPFTFQLYKSGIYDDPFCLPWTLNHAMLLVGYTADYWILMNWWGSSWGEDGYMRLRRGSNRCGITNMAMYVEI